MKRNITILLLLVACISAAAQDFARGADISWATEMEADGRKFYTNDGVATDIFALMKQIGMNAIRLRVFVDPEGYGYGPWCDKADVVAKARRAQAQGLDVMIDFHYSDFFTDPGRQNVPKAWDGYTMEQVKDAIANHTTDVLQALNDSGISPKWVQVGNETNSGIAMDYGKIDWDKTGASRFANYTLLSNAGYDAVKSEFPDAQVIVHLGGTENAQWFFPDFIAAGGKFDMIGLSHYPTEDQWDSTLASANCSNVNAAKYVADAISRFDVPVMICETGFDVSKPALAQRVMIDLFNRMTAIERCAGIFYWEPEVDGIWKPAYYQQIGWDAYGKGAFTTNGRPTKALDAFGGKTVPDEQYPASLGIYATDYSTLLATLLPTSGNNGIYSAQLEATEPWMNFVIHDSENGMWYGTDPDDKTLLSAASDKWNIWIDSQQTGIYSITVDLTTMRWTHSFFSSVEAITTHTDLPMQYFDLMGRSISTPRKGHIYVVKQGPTASIRHF